VGAREYTLLFLEIGGLLLVKVLFIQLLIHSWQVRGKRGVPPTYTRQGGKETRARRETSHSKFQNTSSQKWNNTYES